MALRIDTFNAGKKTNLTIALRNRNDRSGLFWFYSG